MVKDDNSFKSKVFSHLSELAKECPSYEDAKMLVGSADTVVSLKNNTVHRSIDTEWIEKIEYTIPYLDAYIRNPGIAIEEIEEVLPVEATKRVSEKSIRYLSQHTNHILRIEGDEVTPSKLLNVFRDETYQTYENKFINTLLIRLIAFIDKRFEILNGTCGIEKNYVFDYQTSFDHSVIESEKNTAKMSLKIELTSPVKDNLSEEEINNNKKYTEILQRLSKIRNSIMSFLSSALITAVGRNYIRPPVIRTNPILKNKNLNACLTLWEYIESVDKLGFSTITDEFKEMPSEDYVYELYSTVALQYLQFYSGVIGDGAENRLISERRFTETFPEFDAELDLKEINDYSVYDSEYKKLVSASTILDRRRKLSEDERKMRVAIEVALRADKVLFDAFMIEDEARKKAEEERIKQEQERIRLEEERLMMLERRKNINYRYVRSYTARLIQSSDDLKQDYSIIKNKILSYGKVKVRNSKKCETFYIGRQTLVKIDVKGKKLNVYLALSVKEFEEKSRFYNFEDVSLKKKDTPMLIKVSGPIKLKRAVELIEILMQNNGLEVLSGYKKKKFYMPYEDTDKLVRRGLIVDLLNKTPIEETDNIDASNKFTINAKYSRSYLARLIQSQDSVKSDYGVIKNKILSYGKVKVRNSKKCETFYIGRQTLVKIDVKGKKLNVYLALSVKEFEEKSRFYNFEDVSSKKKDTPMLIKVSGPNKLKRAVELIEILMQNNGLEVLSGYETQNFYMDYEDTNALIKKGLITKLGEFDEKVLQENNEEVALTTDDVVDKEGELPVESAIKSGEEVVEQEKVDFKTETVLKENQGIINGYECVFKPYFEGYKDLDLIIIPIKKDTYYSLKPNKQEAIFKSALKKYKKKLKKI